MKPPPQSQGSAPNLAPSGSAGRARRPGRAPASGRSSALLRGGDLPPIDAALLLCAVEAAVGHFGMAQPDGGRTARANDRFFAAAVSGLRQHASGSPWLVVCFRIDVQVTATSRWLQFG